MKIKTCFIGLLFAFVIVGASYAQEGLRAFQRIALGTWEIFEAEGQSEGTIIITETQIRMPDEFTLEYEFTGKNIYFYEVYDDDDYEDSDCYRSPYTLIDRDSFSIRFEGETLVFRKTNNDNFTMSLLDGDYDDVLHFRRVGRSR